MKTGLATGKQTITYVDPGHLWELVHEGKAVDTAKALGWEPTRVEAVYHSLAIISAVMFLAKFVSES